MHNKHQHWLICIQNLDVVEPVWQSSRFRGGYKTKNKQSDLCSTVSLFRSSVGFEMPHISFPDYVQQNILYQDLLSRIMNIYVMSCLYSQPKSL